MTDTLQPQAQETEPPRGLWPRMRHHILHPDLSPRQIALSFAIGFSISWNPFLGLHTWIVLGLCFVFRKLHMPLMLLAAFINNPWTMVPIATASAYAGNLLLGRGLHLELAGIRWHAIGLRSFTSRAGLEALFRMLKPVLAPYVLGGLVLCSLALPVGYVFMLWLTKRLRRVHWRHGRGMMEA